MKIIIMLMLLCISGIGLLEVLSRGAYLKPLVTLACQAALVGLILLELLALIVLFIWRVWLRWSVKLSPVPVHPENFASVLNVRLDPTRGIIMDILRDDTVIPVIVNPNYWQFLPSPALSRADGNEATILGNMMNKVNPGSEPASLVSISNGTSVVGMGARVNYNGTTWLLTASHVWNGTSPVLYLAKGGLQTEVSAEWPVGLSCTHRTADFVMVRVPDRVWSRLGVKSAPLAAMAKTSIVTIFSDSNGTMLSSSGRAVKGEYSHDIQHTCSTTNGWSGSPLYYKGAVVGIHCGLKDFGVSNRGVNVGVLLTASAGLETVYSEISNTLISPEEADERDYEFIDLDIVGGSRLGMGKGEYFKQSLAAWESNKKFIAEVKASGRKTWAELTEEEHAGSLETTASHLNFKRAEIARPSPPSFLLQTTSGKEEINSAEEMPLYHVGKSSVQFRETSRKALSARIIEAVKEFPELSELSWPERGSKAERGSLLLQAGKFKATKEPPGVAEACRRLCSKYPRSKPTACLRGEQWDYQSLAKTIAETCESNVNLKASPGVPLSIFSSTNGGVLATHRELVINSVIERIELLSEQSLINCELTPRELVAKGFCDPVRVFVKQEPHAMRKIREGRYRLISSVSLIDQLVERLIFGPQNQLEIQRWRNIPSKPGMGLSLYEQAQSIWSELSTYHDRVPAAEADISGFDWSVQDWELWADLYMRIELGSFGPRLRRAAESRFYCFMNSVFQLSDGTLIEQGLPGLMKSGSYCTSSTNSRIRCLMAELIGAEWCVAMGDDSVEAYVPRAAELYSALGHTCKDYVPCETDSDGKLLSVNFCSHVLKEGEFWLTSWPKTLFRFLSAEGDLDDLQAELWSCPQWKRIMAYVGAETPTNKVNGEAQIEATIGEGDGNFGRGSDQPITCQAPIVDEFLDRVEAEPTSNCTSGGWYSLW
nr:polyprotein P2a-P2b [Cymbidium chlorotic mosaic virus]